LLQNSISTLSLTRVWVLALDVTVSSSRCTVRRSEEAPPWRIRVYTRLTALRVKRQACEAATLPYNPKASYTTVYVTVDTVKFDAEKIPGGYAVTEIETVK
jgi:hypothetical protein